MRYRPQHYLKEPVFIIAGRKIGSTEMEIRETSRRASKIEFVCF